MHLFASKTATDSQVGSVIRFRISSQAQCPLRQLLKVFYCAGSILRQRVPSECYQAFRRLWLTAQVSSVFCAVVEKVHKSWQ